ncbi:transporter substrate-binding domain-containing protein [Gracilibacillus sp. YIM 98692]|uniref:transporter substrate-binding domain-containing protein n=1 Tax=Gracilibacillus sp. YIM 98692 TaxID=2663532 RepID=UPI0013D64714|nr:transporter substrate-binding domain-containing protein [Gracilibacillus sp. YIM 98692]
MKKKFYNIVAVMLTVFLLAACGAGGETYTVATDANFQPFEYKNPETGKMEGFDIELIKAIAEEAGFNVEFETMQFDGLLAGIKSARYPMAVAGISITEERKKTINFSDKYYNSGLIVMVPTESDIQSVDDLAGKKVGTRQGSTSQEYLQNNTDAEIEAFPAIVDAYMALKSGRLDAVLYDLPNVKYFIQQEGEGKLKTVGKLLEGQPYGIAFPKDSDLVDDVNEALQTIKDNGTYDEIYKKWFGEAPE